MVQTASGGFHRWPCIPVRRPTSGRRYRRSSPGSPVPPGLNAAVLGRRSVAASRSSTTE
jgi:hypothetical protein